MIGVGVMIGNLGGNEETVNAIKSSLGKEIATVSLDGDELVFKFTDNAGLRIFDDGQSCCESRYMNTDDDLSYFAGAKLLGFELKDAPNENTEYDSHEIQFLDVTTDKGVFQMSSHNQHNGYYGGFLIVAKLTNQTLN